MRLNSKSYSFLALAVLVVLGFVLSQLKARPAFAQVGDGVIQTAALRHDTFDPGYRNPFGAVPAGATVRLRFRTALDDVQTVAVFYYQFDPATGANTPNSPVSFPMTFSENRIENGTSYSYWEYNLTTPNIPAILYYKFKITDAGTTVYYSDSYVDDNDNLNKDGDGAPSTLEPFPAFQLTVYDPNFQTPAWLQNANVYQIFPDRFRNGDKTNDYGVPGSTSGSPVFYGSQPVIAHTTWNEAIYDPRQPGPYAGSYGNQFFGGDLKGVQDKLDYLQSLGFDTLYLTPIFQARSNHRYDTDNYLTTDPALGGDAALASLLAAMSQRGMHLILDGVFNHASSDSFYFDRYHRYGPPNGACESLNSPFRSWFLFNTNNVPCGSNDYTGWFGFDGLPRFDKSNAGYRDFIYRGATDNVIKHWYDRGASGWRFDVADDGDLRKIWHEFRPYAKSYKADGPLIGEVWPNASQFLAGDQMDSVMNYRFRKNVLGFARGAINWADTNNNGGNELMALTPSQFDRALRAVRQDYPPQATNAMLNLIDSHDTNRALFVLTEPGDNGLQQAKERLKLAALFQFTYLGAPMVYYGDEAAINAPGKADNQGVLQGDPYNRAPYPWNDEAGDPSIYGPADGNVLAYYNTLANLRKQHPALRTGIFESLLTGDSSAATTDENTFAFARSGAGEVSVVALNNGPDINTAAIPVNTYFADGTVLLDAISGATYTVANGAVTLNLLPRTGVVMFPQLPTPTPTPVETAIQFSTSNYAVGEGDGHVETIVTRIGDTSGAATVSFSTSDQAAAQNCNVKNGKASSRCDYEARFATVKFAPGETSKTISILIIDDSYLEGPETFQVNLSNPLGGTLGAQATATVTIIDNDLADGPNPVDTARFFVKLHYLDFLNREPDQGGWDFWTNNINNCMPQPSCIDAQRINTSAAYFLSIEFQQTGYLVERMYKTAYGDANGSSTFGGTHQLAVPVVGFTEFLPDTQEIGQGVVVGQTGWEMVLENNKQAFALEFVQRARFTSALATSMTPAQFVDKLFANAGFAPSTTDRSAVIAEFGSATNTTDASARARALRDVAENSTLNQQEFNRAFVLMQFFGYLRRNPNSSPDSDYTGYDFWLTKLNQFNGNFVAAEMVKAFITSTEYRSRFGP